MIIMRTIKDLHEIAKVLGKELWEIGVGVLEYDSNYVLGIREKGELLYGLPKVKAKRSLTKKPDLRGALTRILKEHGIRNNPDSFHEIHEDDEWTIRGDAAIKTTVYRLYRNDYKTNFYTPGVGKIKRKGVYGLLNLLG